MKNNKRTFFLIPGFGMQLIKNNSAWLTSLLLRLGFKVVKVPVKWKYKTLSQNTEEFIQLFNKHKSGNDYVLGFSYGAVIALLSANILKPKKIFLCSLSPDFVEDINIMKSWIKKYIGKRRFNDAKTRSGKKFAKELKIPSVVFYGEEEAQKFPELKKRCEETACLAKNSKLVVVKDAPHDICFSEYMLAVKNELKNNF